MENNNEKQAYLDALVAELMEDTEWELPVDQRDSLKMDLAWNMVGL